MSEKENMLAGLFYNSLDPELVRLRQEARRTLWQYNATDPADAAKRRELTEKLFGRAGENLIIEPPFYCDYGSQIHFGNNVFLNFNCTILDCARVEIGDGCLLGPNVQIYTATHSTKVNERMVQDWSEGDEICRTYALPVKIEDGVWIGGGSIILPGVTIGRNSVIGAGSVVTRSIPADCVAVGNPCRVIRHIDNEDQK